MYVDPIRLVKRSDEPSNDTKFYSIEWSKSLRFHVSQQASDHNSHEVFQRESNNKKKDLA